MLERVQAASRHSSSGAIRLTIAPTRQMRGRGFAEIGWSPADRISCQQYVTLFCLVSVGLLLQTSPRGRSSRGRWSARRRPSPRRRSSTCRRVNSPRAGARSSRSVCSRSVGSPPAVGTPTRRCVNPRRRSQLDTAVWSSPSIPDQGENAGGRRARRCGRQRTRRRRGRRCGQRRRCRGRHQRRRDRRRCRRRRGRCCSQRRRCRGRHQRRRCRGRDQRRRHETDEDIRLAADQHEAGRCARVHRRCRPGRDAREAARARRSPHDGGAPPGHDLYIAEVDGHGVFDVASRRSRRPAATPASRYSSARQGALLRLRRRDADRHDVPDDAAAPRLGSA